MTHLASERVGQLFVGEDRLEYTEHGAGSRWLVLVHGQLMTRRMHEPLARSLAAQGLHVVTLDLLGHGRSDRPVDPAHYSVSAFAEQVVALLDHLGAATAVVGGISLGANVALEVAVEAPERVIGLLLEMPVLDRGLDAGLLAFAPVMLTARFAPAVVTALRAVGMPVPRGRLPFWAGVALDVLHQRPASLAATVRGIFLGRIAPSRGLRRTIRVPALVVGHRHDPIHPWADAATLAGELPRARFVEAHSLLEWRLRPERLDAEAVAFVTACWRSARRRSRTTRRRP